MKKVKLLILISLSGLLASMAQINLKDNVYFPIELNREVVFIYKGSENYVKYISLKEKSIFNDKEYNVRIMQYSWGKTDTTYFRTEDETVYYFDRKSNTESINIPKDIKLGLSWTSTDNAWKYEITSVSARLETPEKKYKNLLEIKATQLQNRDKTKLNEYLIYYAKNVGKVASVTNRKLMTYRIEN